MPSQYITQHPERMSSAPCFVGTRVPVAALFDYLAAGDSLDELLDQFPTLSRSVAVQVLGESGLVLLAA